MSILVGNPFLLNTTAATGYQVSRSLRFNASDSAYLSRSASAASTSNQICTISFWVKRSTLGSKRPMVLGPTSGVVQTIICQFKSDDTFGIYFKSDGSVSQFTLAVFRDTSAWYHILVAIDTTQATASNRCKIFVNGIQQTSLTGTAPSQNYTMNWGSGNSDGMFISSNYETFDGLLADVFFIDGQALTPSSFTEVSATTGQLVPKAYSGSFGTNGFWLKFSDNSAATATTLGKDYSGNSNNWTPNNLSVTAGAGNDSLVDTPTSYGTDDGLGGSVRGNYATLNPLDKGANVTLTNGNLDVSTASTWNSVRATFGLTSGKWYWEYTMTAAGYTMIGIGTSAISLTGYIGQSSAGYAFYSLNGNKWNAGTAAAYGNSFTTSDVIGVAFDADAGKIWFAKNGTWQASGDPAAGTNAAYSSIPSGSYFPTISQDNSLPAATGGSLNAGARSFAYTAPSGFKALCDTNLPAPVIAKPSTVMDVVLYTGNGSTQTISGLGFSPDLVWIKARTGTGNSHVIQDQIRGATAYLFSNATTAENTNTGNDWFRAFTSDGFTVAYQTTGGTPTTDWNANTVPYVAWTWDAGSSTVTNTQGSITSSVRANASAGFSIVTYTGTSSNGTVGHGLGVAPGLIFVKARSTTSAWQTYHISTGKDYTLQLNNTNAQTNVANYWGSTTPSSTVFGTLTGYDNNINGATMVAYCFAPVAGYSSFGSYTGNGSTDGPFVFTGFKPAFVMMKMSSSTSHWWINDNKRTGSYNVADGLLFPNLSSAESTFATMDLLSNGFKLRAASSDINTSSATYIYAAFAENPFQYARAR